MFLLKPKIGWTFVGILFIVYLIVSLYSPWSYGGTDDIVHYRFARYSFMYPHLLLDHWAKPLFTLLASPFAQTGYWGMRVFNLVVGLLTAIFVYKTSTLIKINYPTLPVFLLLFTPVYVSMLLSGMTEVIFGFVFLLSVYLALRKNFWGAAIVLSFIIFVRNEGIVFLPFFAFYFLYHRKFLPILLLSTGFWVYSIIGSLYYHDFWWVITRMPYPMVKEVYGSGPLMHFVLQSRQILGIPISILFLIGCILSAYVYLKKRNTQMLNLYIVAIFPVFAYFITHSVLWWQGWGGSLGLIRVMAGLAPVTAIIASYGIDKVFNQLLTDKLRWKMLIILLFLIVPAPFRAYKYPVAIDGSQKVIKQAALWARESGQLENKLYYYDHYFWFFLDINPFDTTRIQEGVANRDMPSATIPNESLIIWDAHFGANEGGLPLEKMMRDSLLQIVKVFKPNPAFTVLNNYDYKVCVFKKLSVPQDTSINYKTYNDKIEIVDVNN